MKVVERYHQPVRSMFSIVEKQVQGTEDESALEMELKSIKDSVGPAGLAPTLPIYGAHPRLQLSNDKTTT